MHSMNILSLKNVFIKLILFLSLILLKIVLQ